MKTLWSDRGGQYLSQDFIAYLKNYGILSQQTPLGTPQLNCVSERINWTLLDMVQSTLSLADLQVFFKAYAL